MADKAEIIISAQDLCRYATEIFLTAGVPEPAAQRTAESLVEANLTGHDSHGVVRIPYYVRLLRENKVDPHAEMQVIKETASTARLDCGHGLGQVMALQGLNVALDKAREHDIAAVTLRHCGHVGRLGEYVALAAEQGFWGWMCSNGPSGPIVAPFGGIERGLSTNPIALSVPGPPGQPPLLLDYATSACAHGKIQIARDKGVSIPEGWLLDKHGQPTQDPKHGFDGGIMLPFGGHKGYAMSVFVEMLAGGLGGAGPTILPGFGRDQGTMIMALNIAVFQPLDQYRQMVGEFVQQIKATQCAPGVDEILVPGEPEWRSKAKRLKEGIPIAPATWESIQETAKGLDL